MPILQITPKLRIHYLEYNPQGSPSVVLLHGLGATGASWVFQIPVLVEAGYRVIAPDARCFGQSTYPGGSVRISDLAADLACLIDRLGIAQTHVVGISMGGTIALQLALDTPLLISRLVLVNTFARLRPKSPNLWFYYSLRFILVHVLGLAVQARAVAHRIFPRVDQDVYRQELVRQIGQADPRGYRAVMRALALFNVANRLGEIHIPTLVITGAADTTVPMNVQIELAHGIPSAKHIIIPEAGHAVTIDQPKLFNAHLLEFLGASQKSLEIG